MTASERIRAARETHKSASGGALPQTPRETRKTFKLTLWGADAYHIRDETHDSLSEAHKAARTAGRHQRNVLRATIKTPSGSYHHFAF